jgi:hypothetical protein
MSIDEIKGQIKPAQVVPLHPRANDDDDTETHADPWEFVDVTTLAGKPTTPPELLRGASGVALIYHPSRTLISGEPESGKTMAAIAGAVEMMKRGERVAWIDTDGMGPAPLQERMNILGADDTMLSALFRWSEAANTLTAQQLQETSGRLIDYEPKLLVVDSFDPALEQAGMDPNSSRDVSTFARCLVNPIYRAGCTVLLLDHVTKSNEGNSRYSSGSGAKLRAVDAHLGMSTTASGRLTKSDDGGFTVKVHKDRHGTLDRKRTYRVQFTHQAGGLTYDVGKSGEIDAGPGDFRPTGLMEKISRYLERQTDSATQSNILDAVTGKDKHVKTAIQRLVDEGYVTETKGDRNSRLFASRHTYREDADN